MKSFKNVFAPPDNTEEGRSQTWCTVVTADTFTHHSTGHRSTQSTGGTKNINDGSVRSLKVQCVTCGPGNSPGRALAPRVCPYCSGLSVLSRLTALLSPPAMSSSSWSEPLINSVLFSLATNWPPVVHQAVGGGTLWSANEASSCSLLIW